MSCLPTRSSASSVCKKVSETNGTYPHKVGKSKSGSVMRISEENLAPFCGSPVTRGWWPWIRSYVHNHRSRKVSRLNEHTAEHRCHIET